MMITIIILAIAGFLIYKNFIQQKAPQYVFEKITRRTVVQEVSETGTVKASEELNLGFKAGGKIEKIYVKTGDEVKSGDNLVKIDSQDLAIKLEKAKATLRVIEARKEDAFVVLDTDKKSLDDAKAKAEKDLETAYKNALDYLEEAYLKIFNASILAKKIYETYFTINDQDSAPVSEGKKNIADSVILVQKYITLAKNSSDNSDVDRALEKSREELSKTRISLENIRNVTESPLYKNSVSSADKTSLDNQSSYINTAYSNIIDSQQNISSVKIANETSINAAQGQVAEAESQLKQEKNGLYLAQMKEAQNDIVILENQISDNYLKSPIAGKITNVEKKKGEMAQANESIITMLSSDAFQIKADIYEEDIVKVGAGNPVDINLVAFPEKTLQGRVISINPAEKIIEGVVYYEITVAMEESLSGMRPGMTADIIIKTNKAENVLAVPSEFLLKSNGKATVEVLDSGKIKKKEIEIGLRGENYIEVVSGLKEGDQVAIEKK